MKVFTKFIELAVLLVMSVGFMLNLYHLYCATGQWGIKELCRVIGIVFPGVGSVLGYLF